MMTRIHDRPSVSGTNRKWYSAVTANCRRDRSTTSTGGTRGLLGTRERNDVRFDARRLDRHVRGDGVAEERPPQQSKRGELHDQDERDVAAERAQPYPSRPRSRRPLAQVPLAKHSD